MQDNKRAHVAIAQVPKGRAQEEGHCRNAQGSRNEEEGRKERQGGGGCGGGALAVS